ncbi:MAG: hypothetical protein IJ232_08120 [Lachnospiraceae bacterium]|nr:hypothetical protein [Lachnospiraceae bacterium]
MTTNTIIKYLFLFIVGGFSYFYMEILFRGFSHFSMIICGGFAFILCGLIDQVIKYNLSLISQMLISTCIITVLELITGYIVNIRLHLNVWDYSRLPYNFHGQICVAYSFIWLILSFLCITADDLIRWKIFDEEKPKYKLM